MLITEGNHITELETSVTPQKAGSKIEVNILLITGMNTVGTQIIGLFENSATSAVASFVKTIGNTVIPQQFSVTYFTSTSNTNSIQYSLRIGNTDSNTNFLNGSTAQRLNVTMISSVVITEHP